MDTKQLVAQYKPAFDRDGYVLIRGFLSPSEVAELNAYFEKFIANRAAPLAGTHAFYEIKGKPETLKYLSHLSEHDAYFEKLEKSDRYLGLAAGLLGDVALPKGVEWFNKCARVGLATPPHQDGYYYMLTPNEAIHFWLALDTVDEGNGCIRYVKGSHRRPMRTHQRSQTLGFSQYINDYGPADDANSELMIMQPGDLLAHHSMTIHRADANTSNRERRAMGFVYYAKRAVFDEKRSAEYQKKLHAELQAAGKI